MKVSYQKVKTGPGYILICLLALGLTQCSTSNTPVKVARGQEAPPKSAVIAYEIPRSRPPLKIVDDLCVDLAARL